VRKCEVRKCESGCFDHPSLSHSRTPALPHSRTFALSHSTCDRADAEAGTSPASAFVWHCGANHLL